MPQVFPVLRVTEYSNTLIQDLEQSLHRLAAIEPTDRQAVLDAYAALSQRRRDVFEWLHKLEHELGYVQTAVLRFD